MRFVPHLLHTVRLLYHVMDCSGQSVALMLSVRYPHEYV